MPCAQVYLRVAKTVSYNETAVVFHATSGESVDVHVENEARLATGPTGAPRG